MIVPVHTLMSEDMIPCNKSKGVDKGWKKKAGTAHHLLNRAESLPGDSLYHA